MTFDEAFERVIGHEGGYSDDPRDRGNWTTGRINEGDLKGTKYGISAMAYPGVDIKNLTLDQAKAIYRRGYWDKLKLDQLPGTVHYSMFDAAVNSGVVASAKFLQNACGTDPDGAIGPKTIAAANAMDPQNLDKRLNGYRLTFLTDLPTFSTYGRGWVKRVASNLLL